MSPEPAETPMHDAIALDIFAVSSTDRLSALLHKRPELRALFLHASVIEEGLRWNA